MTDKAISTSVTLPAEARAVAFCIGIIERVWSREAQQRIVRLLMAYYGVTL